MLDFLDCLRDISFFNVALRMCLAVLCGGIIGAVYLLLFAGTNTEYH